MTEDEQISYNTGRIIALRYDLRLIEDIIAIRDDNKYKETAESIKKEIAELIPKSMHWNKETNSIRRLNYEYVTSWKVDE